MKNKNFRENNTTFRTETLSLYFAELNKHKTLTNEQVIDALKKGETEKVINANLKLVVSIAKGYQGLGLSLEDLIQEGNIGLCMATQMYDASRGTLFSTCALQWIVKYITIALTDKSRGVRLPKYMVKDAAYLAISFDAPLGHDDDGNEKTLLDTFASDFRTDKFADIDAIKQKINALLKGLDEREREIVCGLFGIGCAEQSSYTLAKRFSITEERVRQIKLSSLQKMANMAKG